MDDARNIRISELMLRSYDGSIDTGDIAEFETLLQDQQSLEYYVETSMNLNYFHCLRQVPLSQPATGKTLDQDFMSELDPQQQMQLLGDFAEYEKNAVTMEAQKHPNESKPELLKEIKYERQVRSINKHSLAIAFLASAALIAMIAYVRLVGPKPYEVATVTDSINAQWSSSLSLTEGTRLSSYSEPVRLTQGIVKLLTNENVQIVVEAPAEFTFVSYSEILLNYGKLYATVSEQGSGFSVSTPNSKIVDLGTEFGVLSQIDGSTEVYMIKGVANLFAGEKNRTKTSQMLEAGAARKVDRRDSTVKEIPVDETAFVRDINSGANLVWKGDDCIRLTDLLLNGNGFGTASQQSVEYDPATGSVVPLGTAGYRTGSGKPALIAESPFLDCVFVPGSGKDNIISSQGHCFKECPATTGQYYSNIICGRNSTFFDPVQQTFEKSKRFNDSGFLYLHSNMGMTVDINEIRKLVPGLQITSFSAFAGIMDIWNNEPTYSEADIWILVDGKLITSRKALRADQGYNINVPISDTDRFLTLVVTDGGKVNAEGFPANHFDTCGFAEPVFGLASR